MIYKLPPHRSWIRCAATFAALFLSSTSASAQPAVASRCSDSTRSDPAAEALMTAIEGDFRRGPRITRMAIQPNSRGVRELDPYEDNPSIQKTLWGVVNGDVEDTRLLYVFSGPGRLAGTTLLMHDRTEGARNDAMWLYLRSFDILKQLEPKTQRVLVPGTILTYEDARGFIPLDKYRFAFSSADSEMLAANEVLLVGCPQTAQTREDLGYDSLLLRVDPEKKLVLRVAYAGLDGRPLKTYTLVSDTQVGGRWFPARVGLHHHVDGFGTAISYEYWLPKKPPVASMFTASIEAPSFLKRLRTYLHEEGLAERIDGELAISDEQTRQFFEKIRRIQEGD